MSEQPIGVLVQNAELPVVFGAVTGCPRCIQLKSDLARANIEVIFVDVRSDESAVEFLKSAGFTSIPQIYIGGVRIGDSIKSLLGVAA